MQQKSPQNNLVQGRGDAYCGMLNASYNLKLRNVGAYIPEYPVWRCRGLRNPTRDKDGRRTSCKEFLELVESLPDEKEDLI